MFSPQASVAEALGVNLDPPPPPYPAPLPIEDLRIYCGDSVELLTRYDYDFVNAGGHVILNGLPILDQSQSPTYVWNTAYFWTEGDLQVRVRHMHFVELFPRVGPRWEWREGADVSRLAEQVMNHRMAHYSLPVHEDLNGFVELISQPGIGEPAITGYLADHPTILQLAFGAGRLNPQVALTWQATGDREDLIPDFMPVRLDGFVDIIEFKLPVLQSAPIVGKAPRRKASEEVAKALSQVHSYRRWCVQEVNAAWLERERDIKVRGPQLILVLSTSSAFPAADRRQLAEEHDVTIVTYDEFVEMARSQLYIAQG